MALYAKSGGSWRSVSTPYIKKSTGWARASGGWINNGTQWVRFFASGIADTFDRANGSLGTTSDGSSTWSVTRGAWSINSNLATSSSTASTYPLAVVNLGASTSVVQAATPVAGSGIAFGVVDANNWYGAFITRRTDTYSCSPYSCNPYCCSYTYKQDCVCGSTQVRRQQDDCATYTNDCTNCPNECANYKRLESHRFAQYRCNALLGWVFDQYVPGAQCSECNCTAGGALPACNSGSVGGYSSVKECLGTSGCVETVACGCVAYKCGSCTKCVPVYDTVCNSCNVCTGGTCYQTCYQTCTGSYYGVRLVRCVNGTVSELGLTEGVRDGFQPLSIRVSTTSSGISVTAYSGTAFTGSTLAVTSALVPTGVSQGILIGPSTVSQGFTVDNFSTEVQ